MANSLEVRQIVFQESKRLFNRDPKKYGKLVLGLHLLPLIVRGGDIGRDSYFFMRHIDDVMDGHLKVGGDVLDYVYKIRHDVEGGIRTDSSQITVLAFDSIEKLNRKTGMNDDPKAEFLAGIDGMVRDYTRTKTKVVFSSDDLRSHYVNNQFGPHHNICFMAIGSNLRSGDIETFSYSQGLSYAIRDMDEDWNTGMINIPQEVLNVAGVETDFPIAEVKANIQIKKWIGEEAKETRINLQHFFESVADLKNEKSANLILRSLGKQVKEILDQNSSPSSIISVSGNNRIAGTN